MRTLEQQIETMDKVRARVQMQPSLSGARQPYCSRLRCWVKEMAICDHYAMKPDTPTASISGAPA